MNILHLDSSPLGSQSASRGLTANLIAHFKTRHPDAQIKYLDLITAHIKPLDSDSLGFRMGLESEALSAEQRTQNHLTKGFIDDVMNADVIIIGAPMYNFTVPAQLKDWIDRLVQAGATFKYTETGPVGLVTGKKVYVLSTRGGVYPAGHPSDHQESYLRTVLGFMGMTDITVIRAEGLAMGADARATAIQQAESEITALAV